MTKASRKPRILIVEDDPGVMDLLSTVLDKSGYDIVKANSALPALFRVVRTPPDLILADLKMPVMNGVELIEQFKRHEETRNIPIVVVTGSSAPGDREAAFKAGCAGFLTKPISVREFPRQIAAFLRYSNEKQDENSRH